jgi:p24 family protein gamma-3
MHFMTSSHKRAASSNTTSRTLPMIRRLLGTSLTFLFVLLVINKNILIVECNSVQLTFELPDNERQCFYEHVGKGVNSIVEFQVVTGGNYDVDMVMKSPRGKILYQDQKKQYDSFRHQAEEEGIYEVCFSNEFSTFTHKVVFFDWTVGDEAPLLSPSSPEKALTFLESSAQNIHDKLNKILDDQTHYRLREAQGRAHAEDLNERVQIWSLMQLAVVVIIGVLQVTLIRSFFSNRR